MLIVFLGGVESGRRQTRCQLKRALLPVPNTLSAPASPTAFGRMKIQFCHADSRPKTRVSIVSVPPKRRFASIPVSASGDRLARSSSATRTSSAQSSSSGAEVTRPRPSAASAVSGWPIAFFASAHGLRLVVEARGEARLAVHHRIRAEILLATARSAGAAAASPSAREHVAAIGSERQFEERAGKARSRLNQRKERARSDVEARQRAAQHADGLPDEPVRFVPQRASHPQRGHATRRPTSSTPTCRCRARWCAGAGSHRPARAPSRAATTRRPPREWAEAFGGEATSAQTRSGWRIERAGRCGRRRVRTCIRCRRWCAIAV